MSEILIFLTVTLNIVLGFLVYAQNRKAIEHIFYACFVLFLNCWILANFLENEPGLVGIRRLETFLRLDFVFGALFMYAWLGFCVAMARRAGHRFFLASWLQWASGAVAIILVPIILFTDLVVNNIRFSGTVIQFDDGLLFLPYALLVLASMIGGPAILFWVRRLADRDGNKALSQSMGLVLVGFIISLGNAVAINLLQPILFISLEVSRIGIYGLSVLVAFTAYAIVRYEFLSVKVIATEAFTAVLWVVLFSKLVIAQSSRAMIVDGLIAVVSVLFGVLLIHGVRGEVRQRKHLEELSKQLQAANAKLEDLSRFKTQLLSIASHQIRSPLAAIKGFSSLLIDGSYGALGGPKIGETVEKIRHSADELIDLINNLLDLRRVEEGRMEYQFAPLDLGALVRETFESLRPLATAKKLEFTYLAPKEPVMTNADGQKLRQVIQNLIDNSIKYTPKGFVRVEVMLTEPGGVLCKVEDSGLGMAPELIPHLFEEEFVRDERVKKQILGTGLGLYIAKKIIEAHGGRIWAESKGLEKGSAFFVALKKG